MRRIHFIAIGGSAMHNLAITLHKKGYDITGSDDEIFEPSRSRLNKYGLLPDKEGWHVDKIHNQINGVIVGMHAKPDNPELKAATEKNLPVFSFPEYLYEHSRNKKRIVIGGSHGKTTTTAMILHVFHQLGIKTDYMVGAQLDGFETMVSLSSDAETMILEGDEYLTSPLDPRPKFHIYQPHTAVITGIAWDHMNVFPTFENYLEQFRIFIRKIKAGGRLFYYSEDPHLKSLMNNASDDIDTRGYSLPEYSNREGVTHIHHGTSSYPMKIFGRHNLLNMEAARLVCESRGVCSADFYKAMKSFSGASNRLEKLNETKDFVLFKDFAHAPSKVKATLNAVREKYPDRKLIALFELHTYSSLSKNFLPHYKKTMNEADMALAYYNPHTLNLKRLPDLSKSEIKKSFDRKDLQVYTDIKEMKQFLTTQDYHNSAVLVMSSGNFGGLDWNKIFLTGSH